MILKNKTALITGSNRGIGLATLIKLSENGADIIACAREKNVDFEKKISEISKNNKNNITPIYFDLNNEEEIERGLKEIEKISNTIEIIINNAGINQISSFQMTSLKKVKEVFQVNLFSNFSITQRLMKILIKNKKGSIINISSNAAYECDAGRSCYSASKSALIAFTKVLSKELGPFNIRVNAIAPGLTKTDMMNDKMSKKLIDDTINKIPIKRAANPEEISNVILFLASDLSSYITGEIINVTGGY